MNNEGEITFEEHELIGKALKIINHKVLNYKRYRNYKTKGKMRKSYEMKSFDLVITLKNFMEEIMFEQYPKKATTDIYYGDYRR